MKDTQILKLRILFSVIGIAMLLIVLYYFIKTDLSKDYPFYLSAGSISLLLIICTLTYGYIYQDVRLLMNDGLQTISRGIDIVQTVSVGLIFLFGTIVGSIFWQHIIIPLIGLSLVTFSTRHGLRFVVFDYSARTVDGLISEKKITFDNLQLISADEQRIQVKILDKEQTVVLNRETCTRTCWGSIIKNLNQVTD